MKFSAKPNRIALGIWIIAFIALTIFVYMDNPDHWSWPMTMGPFFMIILFISMMNFVSYKIEEETLYTSYWINWKGKLDLNKLISAQKKKSGFLKRLFGFPAYTIELYVEREGHIELWTDEEQLLKELKAYERSGNPSPTTS